MFQEADREARQLGQMCIGEEAAVLGILANRPFAEDLCGQRKLGGMVKALAKMALTRADQLPDIFSRLPCLGSGSLMFTMSRGLQEALAEARCWNSHAACKASPF